MKNKPYNNETREKIDGFTVEINNSETTKENSYKSIAFTNFFPSDYVIDEKGEVKKEEK